MKELLGMWRFIPICPRKKSGESTNWPHISEGGEGEKAFFSFLLFRTRPRKKWRAIMRKKSWEGGGGKIVSNFLKSHFPSTCKRNGEERERAPIFQKISPPPFLSPIFDSELNRKETYGGNSLFPGSFLFATHTHFPLMHGKRTRYSRFFFFADPLLAVP